MYIALISAMEIIIEYVIACLSTSLGYAERNKQLSAQSNIKGMISFANTDSSEQRTPSINILVFTQNGFLGGSKIGLCEDRTLKDTNTDD